MMHDDDSGVRTRHVARTSDGLAHRNTLVVTASLRGRILWPTFRASPPPPAAHAQTTSTVVKHHYEYLQGASQPSAAHFHFDDSHPGDPLPEVQVMLLPRPASGPIPFTTPTGMCLSGRRREMDTSIEKAREAGTLRACRTDGEGRFRFDGLEPGDFIVAVERPFRVLRTDGVASDHRVRTGNLALFASVKADAVKATLEVKPDQSPIADNPGWDGNLYVLPTMEPDPPDEILDRAVTWLQALFDIEDRGFVQDQILSSPIVDGYALSYSLAAGSIGEKRLQQLLRWTLFEHLDGGLGLASDQFVHGWAEGSGKRTWLPFVPLDDGFFERCHARSRAREPRRRWLWSRFPLRDAPPALSGADVIELKTRLVLWGDSACWVDVRDPTFDDKLRRALLRFKHHFGLRSDQRTFSSVVDRATHEQLDQRVPTFALDAVASNGDPTRQNQRVYPWDGFDRIVHFAIKNAFDRLVPSTTLFITSAFRCLAHNREVYRSITNTTGPNMNHNRLVWRLASPSPTSAAGPDPNAIFGIDNQGAQTLAHQAGQHVHGDAVWNAARGTYQSPGGADLTAPDYSNHIQGLAVDFRYVHAPSGAHASMSEIQALYTQLLGTGVTDQQDQGRVWLEPLTIGAAARRIHLDSSKIALDHRQHVLSTAERDGARFVDSVVVCGTVFELGGEPAPYAKVELSGPGIAPREFFADAHGRYAVYGSGTSFPAPYRLRVVRDAWSTQTIEDPHQHRPARDRTRNPAGRAATLDVVVAAPGAVVAHDLHEFVDGPAPSGNDGPDTRVV